MNDAPLTCPPLPPPLATRERLPLAALLALATAGFITVMTEAMPAGLLPQMSDGLGVSQALIGQLVTLYAIGSILAAIPLTIATRTWRRRPLLLSAISGFAIANSITAVSDLYWLTLIARFIAGVFAGLLWALLAGYASRMVAPHLQGRAITVAMLGAPIALSLGIPAGTLLGTLIGWRLSFAIMTALTVLLVIWVRWQVPDFPGDRAGNRLPLRQVFTLPGVRSVLFVTLSYVVAHNLLYTYIAPFLQPSGLASDIDLVLLMFGVASVLSLWVVGSLIDRWLRELVIISTLLFMLSAIALGLWRESPNVIYIATAIWGLAFGAMPSLLQTASAKTAKDAADTAQSMLVTLWNVGIAGGGLAGGLLLDSVGVGHFPWIVAALLVSTLYAAVNARHHGFPRAG
ncbi:putative MFS family arabinose efflux permease [Pseudomonas baetica]|uniref:MFS family arabinose efflux permease n=1 Tax=Pseudomonas baetica TaxID=674054 RepID=A0ABX4PVX4_9PSED|nr:MFS transporter [Pseudomonas baetica]PKA68336.1 putative MFS family arabinose efflux permease [Pseudomonas baetica]